MEGIQNMKKRLIALTIAALVIGTAGTALAATEHWNDASAQPGARTATYLSNATSFETWKNNWEHTKQDYQQISLSPGRNETELNFGWYSKKSGFAKIRISKSGSMADYKEFSGTSKKGTVVDGVQYYTNKVTVTGLEPNTSYYYQYLLNGFWQDKAKYQSQGTDSFSMLLVGDPQIGASVSQVPKNGDGTAQSAEIAARNDSYNWNVTLNSALKAHPDVSMILSAGDQINETVKDGSAEKLLEQEREYAGFLSSQVLKSVPLATTIGNHDSLTAGYQNHFNIPNPYTQEKGATAAGNGYYYRYGNALFIVINTNNYNAADHKALIDKAVKSFPNAKWKILMFHQDIYGSGLDHSDSDGIILRTQLTPIIDEYQIDVVLQGHDHTYSRTYQLTGDAKAHAKYDKSVDLDDSAVKAAFLAQNQCYQIVETGNGTITNPEGTVYFATNSATGSKYYELIPMQQDYIAARSQTWTPTYSLIQIDQNQFTINTYEAATGKPIDQSYTIVKTK